MAQCASLIAPYELLNVLKKAAVTGLRSTRFEDH
jgi:hypothetical protein